MVSIELCGRFKRIVRHAGRERDVADTLERVIEGFGKPHVHSGLSIRKLGKTLYECRTSLNWRLVFEARRGALTFVFAGDHGEVRDYLRAR